MQKGEGLDAGYPCLDCEDAAEAHNVHPFFDRPSWREGFQRGYEEGRRDGEHLARRPYGLTWYSTSRRWRGMCD